MNSAAADRIAKAVLYEGYMLYPYRPSAVKNQQRFNFGVVYPQLFSEAQKGTDPWTMQTECLVQGNLAAKLEVQVRFLQLVERSVETIAEPASSDSRKFHPVKALAVDGQTFYSWQEAAERELNIPSADLESLGRYSLQRPFHLASSTEDEELRNAQGMLLGRIVRTQHSIDGLLQVRADQVAEQVFKITVRVRNITPLGKSGERHSRSCAAAFAGVGPRGARD